MENPFDEINKKLDLIIENLDKANLSAKPKFEEDLMTRNEAIDFLSINSSTLWTWTNKGRVKAYGIGGKRYYKKSELLEAIKLKK